MIMISQEDLSQYPSCDDEDADQMFTKSLVIDSYVYFLDAIVMHIIVAFVFWKRGNWMAIALSSLYACYYMLKGLSFSYAVDPGYEYHI